MNSVLPAKTAATVQRLLGEHEKKAKASVSLSGELIRAADAVAGKAQRSALVERAVRAYLRSMLRRARRAHDLQAINASAEITNRESDDLLSLQSWPE
jgi:metal-responsive CopG/Arc/MetJ family transcriptional regulator